MRLKRVEFGHRFREKLIIGFLRLIMFRSPPDVCRTVLYRRDFWGDAYTELVQNALRGPSEWSIGEREMFGAFVSKQVECQY